MTQQVPLRGISIRYDGSSVFVDRPGVGVASIALDDAHQASCVARNLLGESAACSGDLLDAAQLFRAELGRRGFLPPARDVACERGIDVLFRLEGIAIRLLDARVLRNRYWQALMTPGPVARHLLIGTAVENYHFLAREPLFDSPALWFPESPEVQSLINEFYASEFGHDDLLLSALESCGYTRQDIGEWVPLPATTALCNSLSHWAATEPLFFFLTVGLLEGREGAIDSFVSACERTTGLPDGFVEPIRRHALINIRAGHGNVSRSIFRHIEPLDPATAQRLESLLPLFVSLYAEFYEQIFDHYSKMPPDARKLSHFGEVVQEGPP
ncbi:MAG: hypothetical protein R3B07_11575 [Polyangiaceae bacterium]